MAAISQLSTHQDCEIRQLAAEYQSFMFLDLAPRTVKKYSSSVDKWFAWAHTKKCKPLPADPNFLALFFIFQIKVCTSASTFNSIVSSISWAHRKMGLISPTDNLLVEQIITAGRTNHHSWSKDFRMFTNQQKASSSKVARNEIVQQVLSLEFG